MDLGFGLLLDSYVVFQELFNSCGLIPNLVNSHIQ